MRHKNRQDSFYRFLWRTGSVIALFTTILIPGTAFSQYLPTAGLVAHYDAGAGVTFNASGEITGWADQSASGNDLVAHGSPALSIDPINGVPVIDLDGQNETLYKLGPFNGFPIGDSGRTVYAVINYEGYGWGGVTFGSSGTSNAFGVNVSPESSGGVFGTFIGGDTHQLSQVPAVGKGWNVQSAVLESDYLSLRINGRTRSRDKIEAINNTPALDTALTELSIGHELGGGDFVDMKVALILIYDRVLSDVELEALDRYLQTKYLDKLRPVPQPGLVGHFESDYGVDLYSDNTVKFWHDRSPLANSLGGRRVGLNSGEVNFVYGRGDTTFIPNELNGYGVLDFDGVEDVLVTANTPWTLEEFPEGNEDRTVYMVVKYEGLGSGGFGYGHSKENGAFGLSINRNGKLRVNSYGKNDLVSDVAGTGAGWMVQSAVFTKGQLVHSVNGVEIDRAQRYYETSYGFRVGISDYGKLSLGADLDWSPAVDMQVAALFVYDRALDAGEQSKLQNYLQDKFLAAVTTDDRPVTQNDSVSVFRGATINIPVLDNDTGGAQPVPSTVVVTSSPNHGTTVVNSDGSISYTSIGSGDQDSFRYIVKGSMGLGSLPATVNVSILAPGSSLPQAGLVSHFEADSKVDTDATGTVLRWRDLQFKNTLYGPNPDPRYGRGDPKLIQGALNGHNVIDFDGYQDALATVDSFRNISDFPIGNDDRTVFMVVNYEGLGSGGFTYGHSIFNEAFGLSVNRRGNLRINAFGPNDLVSNTVGTGAGWMVQSARHENSEIVHSVDGVEIDRAVRTYATRYSTGPGSYSSRYGQVMLGADLDRSPAVDMQVAALLVYDRALLPEEQRIVQQYLQNKYFDAGL